MNLVTCQVMERADTPIKEREPNSGHWGLEPNLIVSISLIGTTSRQLTIGKDRVS